jgi:hypothetical protein
VNGFSTAISGASGAIGRYFSIVSFIPSLFLASFTFALIQSDALASTGQPDWAKSGSAFTHVGSLALLILLSLALGVIVHPIQFALVQFFEGYWGAGRLAQRARVGRILHHYNRFMFLQYDGPSYPAILELDESGDSLDQNTKARLLSITDESARLRGGYPREADDIMPTRLGNVLRKYERLAGSQYKLDAVKVIRHVAFVAPPGRVEYLNDQRQQLDLAVRMSATSILATFVAIIFLWRHGLWLLIALAPYGISYLSYRGAVTAAHEYGAAVNTIIDLDRFALYDYLRIRQPANTEEERAANIQLMELLGNNTETVMPYTHPDSATGGDKEAKAP